MSAFSSDIDRISRREGRSARLARSPNCKMPVFDKGDANRQEKGRALSRALGKIGGQAARRVTLIIEGNPFSKS